MREMKTKIKILILPKLALHVMELLMLVNRLQKWTPSGVISFGVFATLNGVINQNLTLYVEIVKKFAKTASMPYVQNPTLFRRFY